MKTNNKIYLIALISVLIILLLFIFLIFPSFNKIITNSNNLSSKKTSISVFRSQAAEVESFKKNYNEYEPNLKKIDQLFINIKNPVDFIEFLEKIALESGIESEISLSPYTLNEGESVIVFQFFSTGDFLKILQFTKALESGPYLIEIKNLTIKNSSKQNASGKNSVPGIVDATFLIKVFAEL